VLGVMCRKGNKEALIPNPIDANKPNYCNTCDDTYYYDGVTPFDFARCTNCTTEKEEIYVGIFEIRKYLYEKFNLNNDELIDEVKQHLINERKKHNGQDTKPATK
jgi:hypothetical protein